MDNKTKTSSLAQLKFAQKSQARSRQLQMTDFKQTTSLTGTRMQIHQQETIKDKNAVNSETNSPRHCI